MAYGFLLLDAVTYASPDKMLSRIADISTNVAAFGDGYAQRSPKGLNNIKSKFGVSFVNRAESEIEAITEFFDTKNGEYFNFTYPYQGGEVTIQVVCLSYKVTFISNEVYSCSSEFKRVFQL